MRETLIHSITRRYKALFIQSLMLLAIYLTQMRLRLAALLFIMNGTETSWKRDAVAERGWRWRCEMGAEVGMRV